MNKKYIGMVFAVIIAIIGFGVGSMFAAKQYNAGPIAFLEGLTSSAYDIPSGEPVVHFVYISPSDVPRNDQHLQAVNDAAWNLKQFYGQQVADRNVNSFYYSVEHYYSPNPESHYNTGGQWDYYGRTLEDGFRLTGGMFNDPNNRWIFINAAMIRADQGAGGTQGVAVLHGHDLRGLAGENTDAPVGRYIGGLGHELGHSFDLPHPYTCYDGRWDAYICNNALMYMGYSIYPNNVFLTEDDKNLLTNDSVAKRYFRPRAVVQDDQVVASIYDVNSDGLVNEADVNMVRSCAVGNTVCEISRLDFNGNGFVDGGDVTIIRKAAIALGENTPPRRNEESESNSEKPNDIDSNEKNR